MLVLKNNGLCVVKDMYKINIGTFTASMSGLRDHFKSASMSGLRDHFKSWLI